MFYWIGQQIQTVVLYLVAERSACFRATYAPAERDHVVLWEIETDDVTGLHWQLPPDLIRENAQICKKTKQVY